MVKIAGLQFVFVLFLFSTSTSQRLSPSKSNKVASTNIGKWVKATINIECESGTEIIFDQLNKLEQSGRITKHFSDSIKKIAFTNPPRGSGTAIFLKYDNHHFLITARHVVCDYQATDSNALAPKIILVENKGRSLNDTTGTVITDIPNKGLTIDFHKNAEISSLFSFEGIGWKKPDSLGFRKASYVFSSIDDDIAILNLEEGFMGREFIKTLYKRNYFPISIKDINSSFNISNGQKIIAIGFPEEVLEEKKKLSDRLILESKLISVPFATEGVIVNKNPGKNYFDADIFVYHGNSGGPAISNNALVGSFMGQLCKMYR